MLPACLPAGSGQAGGKAPWTSAASSQALTVRPGSCCAQGPAFPWARAQPQLPPSPKPPGGPSCLLMLCSPQGYPGPAGDRGRPGRRGDKVGLGNSAQQ